MTDKFDSLISALKESPEERSLTGLEARVWRRLDAMQPSPQMRRSLLFLRVLPIVLALGVGGTVGARAMPTHDVLTAFSPSPTYSVLRLVD